MASASLSAGNIRLLANDTAAKGYWEEEASVNGVWVGLLADAFPGSDGFVLQPEGQGEGGYMRNDVLVRKIVDFQSGKQEAYLVFEGKSSRGNLNTAGSQLLAFVRNSPKISGQRRVWGVVACGVKYRLYFFLDGKAVQLKLGKPRVDDWGHYLGKPSQGPPSTDYTLGLTYGDAGCVESLQRFLAYARDHVQDFYP
ncbi:hypothetical protein QBC47DRAFT_370318 [Echria macrotheca]|uniref:Uncharacterized protein n=1 Tax=Echria macrotheca TaxID=438768 RepID=A0AAJ0FBW4_9PEZI|nr:hypothetical protein QBC47DRAFT_370318 [Echria macrotheca]